MLRRDFGGQEVDCFSDQKQQLDRRYSPLSSNRRMPHLTRKYWMHLVSLMNSYPISRPPVECCNIQQEESTLPLCGLVERQLPSIGRTGREPDAGFDPRGSRALDVQAHMCYSPPMTPTTPPTGSFPLPPPPWAPPVATSLRDRRGSAASPLQRCWKTVARIRASSYEIPQNATVSHTFSGNPGPAGVRRVSGAASAA